MNLRKLEHFLDVCQFGGLSRAAEQLGISQPALSRDMRDLEQEFGVPLFRRQARGLVPTAAGLALKQKAEALLRMLENIRDEVTSATDRPSGRLAFGVPPSMAGMLTGSLIERYRKKYPDVQLHLREAMSTQLRDALLARQIDVAVLSAPVNDAQFMTRPLLTESMMLVGPPDSTLITKKVVTLDVVAKCPLIAPAWPNSARLLMETALESIGHKPIIAMETDAAPLAELVRRGVGYAVIPRCALSSPMMSHPSLRSAAIKGLSISWVMACPAGIVLSHAAALFYQEIYDICRSLVESRAWEAKYLGPSA